MATCTITSAMNRAKIFQFIQASNTITVFAASLMAIALFGGGALIVMAEGLFSRNSYSGYSAAIAPDEDTSETKLELAGFRPLSGTPYLLADQVAKQYSSRGVLSSSSYDKQVSTRNYLFFDGNSKTSQWLRPDSEFLFLSHKELTQTKANNPVVQQMLYSLVKADSNDDQQLNNKDAKTIALSTPDGKNYKELIQNIDRVEQIHQHNDERVLVFYRTGDQSLVADIDFTQAKVISTQELPLEP